MAPRTRGANALADVPIPPSRPEAVPEPPAAVVMRNDIVMANGTDQLPQYLLNWEDTQRRLRDPFDPDDVYFLPQTVDYKNGTAIAAAYATPRAYTERMNSAIGAGFWKSEVTREVIAPFLKMIKAKLDYRNKDDGGNPKVLEPAREIAGNKYALVARVAIWMGPVLGWVWHDSTGAEETSDENWTTTAEAQAYKRAMSKFGPGEYFYHFGKQSYGYDTRSGRWKQQPVIPDWAYPNHDCAKCGVVIEHFNYTDKDGNASSKHFWDIVLSTRNLYGEQLCAACAKAARAAQVSAEAQTRLQ